MPKFSAFQPFGHFRFTSKRPHGETLYQDKLRNSGAEENFQGPVYRGKLFCDAMLAAGVLYFLERIGAQYDPRKAAQLLPVHEHEYGLTPSPTATESERRAELYAYRRLKPDARASSLGQALVELLGDKLVTHRVKRTADIGTLTEIEEAARYAETSDALMVPHSVPIQIGRLLRGVHDRTAARKLFEVDFVFGSTDPLRVGQKIIIDPGRWRKAEVVTIQEYLGDNQYRAITRKPHDAGAYVLTSTFPLATSKKRRHYIALEYPWAEDRETRRKIHNTMRIATRAVSTWQIMDGDGGDIGPFTIGEGRIGITPLGAFS
jgi:hypothetical protein